MKRRKFLGKTVSGLTLVGLGPVVLPLQAQGIVISDAINKAGRQRMLSQRMGKAWLALGQGVNAGQATKILQDSVNLFDQQMAELKDFAPTSLIKNTYNLLGIAWADYKIALTNQTPSMASASNILALDTKVLKLAHQGTTQLEAFSGVELGKLINICGRQRMLSQRTAKYYLSLHWGVDPKESSKELELAKAEFLSAMNVLFNAPQTTNSIKQQLMLANQQWVFFSNALNNINSSTRAKTHAVEVFNTSERILQVMDQATGLYNRIV